ncbi:MAG: RdgB/HAM1 family non-canonical purine NTP pyrophosphatase [Candidatus Undinarchaeales archaeon]
MSKVYFATSNPWKYREVKEKFEKADLDIGQINMQLLEIQDGGHKEIALTSARDAFEKEEKPLFVEDAGLHIKALKGFPGEFSAYVFKTLGIKGILKLMENVKNREAEFISVISYKDSEQEKVFKAVCRGSITCEVRGKDGFGYDPIFKPKGHDDTFAEDYSLKKELSHRVKSTDMIINWLKDGKKD